MPDRIQLSRAKGWRMPEGAVKVDRTTIWGNPFSVKALQLAGVTDTEIMLQARCVEAFRQWLNGSRCDWSGPRSDDAAARILDRLPELRGKSLACWCKPETPCHADVLMEMANA